MKPRINAARQMDLPHLTSSGMHVAQDVGVSPPPEAVGTRLPDRYGLPLFELLVVDTEYVFVSWEITPEQIAEARARLPESDWLSRRLLVLIKDGGSGELIQHAELYGEVGRWFIHLKRCGIQVQAALGWQCASGFDTLLTAGPVAVPRDFIVEPQGYDDLYVQYGRGLDGRLAIKRISREPDAPWPQITLPQPEIITEVDVEPRAPAAGVQSWTMGSGVGLRKRIVTPTGAVGVSSGGLGGIQPGPPGLPSSTMSQPVSTPSASPAEPSLKPFEADSLSPPPAAGPQGCVPDLKHLDSASYNELSQPSEPAIVPEVPKTKRGGKRVKKEGKGK